MAETIAERLRKVPPVKLPRSVKHATSKNSTWGLSDYAGRLIEHEVADQLREPYVRCAKDELEAICADSQATMNELFPQLSTLRDLASKLEVAYLYHWHRKAQADRLLAKLNGKLKTITLRKGGGRKIDPEAAYLAKYKAASKEEKLRMLQELKEEV